MKFVAMPRYQMRKNALKKLLKKDCQNKKILEIGYGAGEIFSLYQKLGLSVDGYDFSEAAYEYARENYKNQNITLLKNMPKPEQQYDYVIACEVLEHIENDVDTLKEWSSYLKTNGKLILSVPAHQKRWGESDVYNGHYRRYEHKELEEKLSKAGMKPDKIYTYDFPSCLFLDGMRDKSRSKNLKMEGIKSKEDSTKTSGIERNFHPLALILSHPALWFPIIKFQTLFYKTDWGSAYILIATKRDRKTEQAIRV